MRNKKKTDAEILKDIIDAMFIIAGHNLTYEDVKDRKDNWFNEYTMTQKEHDIWFEWMVAYLRKHKHLNKNFAHKTASVLSFKYGLYIPFIKPEQESE